MTYEEYALACERNGILKEVYVSVARKNDKLREENEELKRQLKIIEAVLQEIGRLPL